MLADLGLWAAVLSYRNLTVSLTVLMDRNMQKVALTLGMDAEIGNRVGVNGVRNMFVKQCLAVFQK